MAPFGEQHTTEAEQEKSAHVSNLQTHREPHLKNNLACVLGEGEESVPFSHLHYSSMHAVPHLHPLGSQKRHNFKSHTLQGWRSRFTEKQHCWTQHNFMFKLKSIYAGMCGLREWDKLMKSNVRVSFCPPTRAVSFGVVLFPPAVIVFFFSWTLSFAPWLIHLTQQEVFFSQKQCVF